MEIFASFVDISDKITDQLTIRIVLNGHLSLNTRQTRFSPIKFSFLYIYWEQTGRKKDSTLHNQRRQGSDKSEIGFTFSLFEHSSQPLYIVTFSGKINYSVCVCLLRESRALHELP